MRITCTEKEKEILIFMFKDEFSQCPFNGEDIGCLDEGYEECIEKNLHIKWEVTD